MPQDSAQSTLFIFLFNKWENVTDGILDRFAYSRKSKGIFNLLAARLEIYSNLDNSESRAPSNKIKYFLENWESMFFEPKTCLVLDGKIVCNLVFNPTIRVVWCGEKSREVL